MKPFVFENPPLMQTEDGRVMGEYLHRQLLALQSSLQQNYRATFSGHAGIFLENPVDLTPDVTITPTPQKVGAYDAKVTKENGATGDISGGTLSFSEVGVWAVGLQVQWEVTPITANATGDVVFYFYNETLGSISNIITSSAVPRYGNTLASSGLVIADISDSALDQQFSIYVAVLPVSVNVTVEAINVMDFYTFRVSNYEYGEQA